MDEALPLIPYRLRRGAGGHRPGAHPSRQGSAGWVFRGHRRLCDGGDPRRLDVQATLRDPLGQWWVREQAEHRAVTVVLLADLSGSMGGDGPAGRVRTLASLAGHLAASTQALGDAFGCLAADQQLQALGPWPPTRRRGAAAELPGCLRQWPFGAPASAGADGLLQALAELPTRPCLVFLASDFHWPQALVEAVFDGLAGHEVVPTVLWRRADFELPARDGLAWLHDAEGGGQGLLWVRPALRARQALGVGGLARAQAVLVERLAPWACPPVFQIDGFDADAFCSHFLG